MKTKISPQSAGGKITAVKLRNDALKKYYKNPNKCLYCKKIIKVKEKQKIPEVKKKKFCNQVCSGLYNNIPEKRKLIKGSICNKCKKYFKYIIPSIYKKRICNNCKIMKRDYVFKNGKSKCKKCGKEVKHTKLKNYTNTYFIRKLCNQCIEKIENKTKEDLFTNKRYYQMARSKITRHAKKVYKENNGPRKCFICNYSKYIEICHKKPVANFKKSSTLKEINNINNLVALCPNHHKELDLGFLKI
jgi:hypothetical protein